ncbi:MAG: SusD/RagB family nutrient-binding outer membrane lipoprotein [Gemmatimonadota bacterium]
MSRFKKMARYAMVGVVALGVAACDSYLDVNEDPNNPQTVIMELTLPSIQVHFAHDVLGPTWIRYVNMTGATGLGTEWMQQWSDNRDRHTYSQHQWYEVGPTVLNGYWNNSYAGIMNEAINMMRQAERNERWQHHGIAQLMLAWNLSLITDAFGPAPFSEAFDPAVRDPAYDSQEQIYAEIFRMADEAIENFRSPDPTPPATNDILFEGDMDAWVRLANSLKARWHMRLAYAPGENTQQRAQAALDALAQGIQSPAQAPMIEYAGEDAGQQNPWYSFETSSEGTGIRSRSSAWYVEMLREHDDPRLPFMANPASWWCPEAGSGYIGTLYTNELNPGDCMPWDEYGDEPIYRGNRAGSPGEPDSAISRLGSFFTADSLPHIWFTYEDTKFLEAEARLNVSGAGAADAPYRAGIRANMERIGVPQAEIDAYMAAVPPLGSQGNPLEEIITEKFKANFLRDEVWHDWRRTGFPDVPPVEERVLDGIPVRLRTPDSETSRNAASVAATGIPTGQAGMLVSVWWASGSPPTF